MLKGCKAGTVCRRGAFVTMVRENFAEYGEWRFREFASGAMVATLRGRAGRVEVWGADHRPEVYFVPVGTKDSDIPCETRDLRKADALRAAVAEACAQAAIQGRMRI
jgi:hypothetical protein